MPKNKIFILCTLVQRSPALIYNKALAQTIYFMSRTVGLLNQVSSCQISGLPLSLTEGGGGHSRTDVQLPTL